MDPRKDYYRILGLDKNASLDQIKKTYRRLAKEYHPDKHAGDRAAEERFKDISEAYSVLSDAQKRREYDMMRSNPFAHGGGSNFGNGGFRVNFGDANSSFGNFDDLFGNLFGFGGQRFGGEDLFRHSQRNRPRKGTDINVDLTIDFTLAARGGETMVRTPAGKRLKIKVPPATHDGKKIRLSGQGGHSFNGVAPGDLIITLHVAPHPKFQQKELDIFSNETINFAQAALGTEIQVETINGKKVKLKIPPGTDSGKKFRLKGMGIRNGQHRGDHYVQIQIESPKNISGSLKKIFRDWAEKAKLI